jgi:hypothetical protein
VNMCLTPTPAVHPSLILSSRNEPTSPPSSTFAMMLLSTRRRLGHRRGRRACDEGSLLVRTPVSVDRYLSEFSETETPFRDGYFDTGTSAMSLTVDDHRAVSPRLIEELLMDHHSLREALAFACLVSSVLRKSGRLQCGRQLDCREGFALSTSPKSPAPRAER